jgi:hypothetical protein
MQEELNRISRISAAAESASQHVSSAIMNCVSSSLRGKLNIVFASGT